MDINKALQIKTTFEKWYLENQNRFKYKLIKESESDLAITYSIRNVIKNIKLVLNKRYCELELEIYSNNRLIDLIPIEYIGCELYDENKGFYDADRVDKNYKYYTSKEGLYTNEVFEKLISFFDKNFADEKYLFMVEVELDGSSYVRIFTIEEMLKNRKNLPVNTEKQSVYIKKIIES